MNVLLVEDNPGDVRLIQEMLAGVSSVPIHLECADRVSAAIDHLVEEEGIDIVVLDLSLPDSRGLDTFCRIYAKAPHIPMVVLSGHHDEALAIQALQEGAQDYLVKGHVDGDLLVRSFRYAIERHRLQSTVQKLTCDELTGLNNRRGFLAHAEQQLKLVHRTKKGLLLFFADLDGLKQINDTHGHLAGDQALIQTAEVLRQTFRASDIVGRLGGDEFAALAIDAGGRIADRITARLHEKLTLVNEQKLLPYPLSLSVGHAAFDPKATFSIEQLIARADHELYEQKRKHHEEAVLERMPALPVGGGP